MKSRPRRKRGKAFLAHWSGESQLATETEALLKAAIPDLEVTVLPRDAEAGFSYQNMRDGLAEARCLIVILTSHTLRQSSWVAWELGMFLAYAEQGRRCPVFPLCIGIDEQELHGTPISGFQAYCMSDLTSAANFVCKVREAIGCEVDLLDPARFRAYDDQVTRQLRRRGHARNNVIEGVLAWMHLDHGGAEIPRPGHSPSLQADEETRKRAEKICQDAYWDSKVHEIIGKLVGSVFAPYVLLHFDSSDVCDQYRVSVPIPRENCRDKLLFQRIAGDDPEMVAFLRENATASQDKEKQSFGYWLLENEWFRDRSERTLGLLALLDEKESRFDAISHRVFPFEGRPKAGQSNKSLVPAIIVPAIDEVDSQQTQTLMKHLNWADLEYEDSLKRSLNDLAKNVKDRWYYGVGMKQVNGKSQEMRAATCSELLFLPIIKKPRMTFEIFPNTLRGAEIPRDLSGLMLLRQCAERFHETLRFQLEKEKLL